VHCRDADEGQDKRTSREDDPPRPLIVLRCQCHQTLVLRVERKD